MAERTRHWVKLWVSWLTTPAHIDLSEGALGLGPLLLVLARWDGDYHSGGWLLADDGSPIGRDALARATHRTRQRLDAQLAELVRCGTLTTREDGAVGFRHYGRWQETSQAKRTRRYRDRHSDAERDGQTLDVRRQTTDQEQPPPTPPPAEGSNAPSSTSSAAPAPSPRPRRGKPRAAPPDGFAQRCFDALVAACRELSPGTAAGPRRLTPGMLDSLAKLYAAEAPTDEEWAAVVRRRLELDRANAGYGALTWEHLCRPANFRRYRDEAMGLPTAETDTNIDEMPAWAMGSDA